MMPNQEAALARADRLAEQILAHAAPLSFGIAQAPSQLEAVFRLRYTVVIARGWARAKDLPDGLERDSFDDRAVQVTGWEGVRLVATLRLVPPIPGQPMPTEQAFGLELAHRPGLIDVGRACCAPGCAAPDHRIVRGLLARAWLELRARGFSQVCGISSPAMSRFYRRLGFQVEVLGKSQWHWGEARLPVLIRPVESLATLRWTEAAKSKEGTSQLFAKV